MSDRLDNELKRMAVGEPAPRAYGQVEEQVWRKIAEMRRAKRAAPALLAARAASVAGALGLGIVAGGATAVAVAGEVQETSAFSVRTELAPSTLLDHSGGGG